MIKATDKSVEKALIDQISIIDGVPPAVGPGQKLPIHQEVDPISKLATFRYNGTVILIVADGKIELPEVRPGAKSVNAVDSVPNNEPDHIVHDDKKKEEPVKPVDLGDVDTFKPKAPQPEPAKDFPELEDDVNIRSGFYAVVDEGNRILHWCNTQEAAQEKAKEFATASVNENIFVMSSVIGYRAKANIETLYIKYKNGE